MCCGRSQLGLHPWCFHQRFWVISCWPEGFRYVDEQVQVTEWRFGNTCTTASRACERAQVDRNEKPSTCRPVGCQNLERSSCHIPHTAESVYCCIDHIWLHICMWAVVFTLKKYQDQPTISFNGWKPQRLYEAWPHQVSTRLQSHQQHYAASKVALTVRTC